MCHNSTTITHNNGWSQTQSYAVNNCNQDLDINSCIIWQIHPTKMALKRTKILMTVKAAQKTLFSQE